MVCMSCTINHTQLVSINLGLDGLGLLKKHQLHHFGLYKFGTRFELVLFVAKGLGPRPSISLDLKWDLLVWIQLALLQEPRQSYIGWPLGIPRGDLVLIEH